MQHYKRHILSKNLFRNLKLHLVYLALVGLISVFFSIGYQYPDEHFQIIEFANALIGRGSFDQLAWEYGSRIRPWLQPFLAAAPLKLGFLISDSPFVAIKLVKCTFVLFVLYAANYFLGFGAYEIDGLSQKERQLGGTLVATSILLAQMVASTSSEIFAAGWLMFVLGYVARNFSSDKTEKKSKQFWLGILIGVMFFSRFQMGFVYAAIGLWLLIVRRSPVMHLLANLLGFFTATMAFVLLDSAIYGGFVITPGNYFRANIIEGVASRFGTSPWYSYFIEFGTSGRLVGGFLSFATLATMLFVRPKSLLTWIFWFFLCGHAAVAHKEERFLYPVLMITPMCWPLLFGLASKLIGGKNSLISGWPIRALITLSCVVGVITAFRPHGQKYGFLEHLDSIGRSQRRAICLDWDVKDQSKPGESWPFVPLFYESPYIKVMFPQDREQTKITSRSCDTNQDLSDWYTVRKMSPGAYFSSLTFTDSSRTCHATNSVDLLIAEIIYADHVQRFLSQSGISGEQLYLWACRRI